MFSERNYVFLECSTQQGKSVQSSRSKNMHNMVFTGLKPGNLICKGTGYTISEKKTTSLWSWPDL